MATAEVAGRAEEIRRGGVTWLDLERPGPADIAALGERFGFHPLDLEDLTSRTERPKLDRRDGYAFLVLHFPVVLARPRRLSAGELHLFVGPDYVVTVHDGDLRPVRRLFEERRDGADPPEPTRPGRLAYDVLLGLIDATAPLTERFTGAIETLQEAVFAEVSREPVRQMALLRREVILLRSMLRADAAVIARLPGAPFVSEPDLVAYWGNADDHIRRLVDYLDDVWQTLEALGRSYEMLASYRINSVMRALTAISTVMLPLAVLSGIYGMNIRGLPWAENPWAFEIVLALMLALATGVLWVFRRRGWM